MAERIVRQLVAEQAIVLPEPALRLPTAVDRNFELPAGLYVAMAVLFFATPAMWMRMKPEHPQRLTSWSRFRRQGIMTAYGHSTAGAATIQVLILPALIFLWGIAVVTIAAVVGL